MAFFQEVKDRIKGKTHIISLDGNKSKERHLVSLFIDRNTAVYFYSFGIEYIPQKL